MKNVQYLILAVFAAITLSGCGVKPSDVDPPAGSEASRFPQTYPDPSTDPK